MGPGYKSFQNHTILSWIKLGPLLFVVWKFRIGQEDYRNISWNVFFQVLIPLACIIRNCLTRYHYRKQRICGPILRQLMHMNSSILYSWYSEMSNSNLPTECDDFRVEFSSINNRYLKKTLPSTVKICCSGGNIFFNFITVGTTAISACMRKNNTIHIWAYVVNRLRSAKSFNFIHNLTAHTTNFILSSNSR